MRPVMRRSSRHWSRVATWWRITPSTTGRLLQPMLEQALSDERLDALVVPIGKGELVCRKL